MLNKWTKCESFVVFNLLMVQKMLIHKYYIYILFLIFILKILHKLFLKK